MKSKYWSCSRFADWIRGTSKPFTATTESWNTWEHKAKEKKLRYWLAEEGLDHLQNIIYSPINCIKTVLRYVNNRWILKSHALTSTLARGRYYDLDTRVLHAVFDELINFVEIESAWMCVVFSKTERKKYRTPWYRSLLRLSLWRNAEAGIAYLNWAAQLTFNNEELADKNDPRLGESTPQALAAQEILMLYRWWKYERPNRLDPSEASGWSAYCEEERNTNQAEETRTQAILDLYHKMEKEQDEEDTAMLIRLIKIRQQLWT